MGVVALPCCLGGREAIPGHQRHSGSWFRRSTCFQSRYKTQCTS